MTDIRSAAAIAQAEARLLRGVELYRSYIQSPAADRIPLLFEAIDCFTDVLSVFTEQHFLLQWTSIHNNLGALHRALPVGNKRQNIAKAIEYYQAALRGYTKLNIVDLWASTQHNLGNAYRELPAGDQDENYQRAIACYEAALQVRTEATFPVEWARTQHSMGATYSDINTGKLEENLRRAIGCFQAALRIFTEWNSPSEWAQIQMGLASAYSNLSSGRKKENSDLAIAYSQAALRVFDEGNFPVQWADAQNCLALAIGKSPTSKRKDDLQRVIDCHLAALQVFTEEDFPENWARSQTYLAAAYLAFPIKRDEEHLLKAIDCYRAALRIYTRNDFPLDWAKTQIGLGKAYSRLTKGNRRDNRDSAIECFRGALACTEQTAPRFWAMGQEGLGDIYRKRQVGDRESDLERTLAHYEAALRVWNREDTPEEWARIHRNLGSAYANSSAGDTSGNLKRAIEYYHMALEIFTEQSSAEDWAYTQQGLGIAYQDLETPDRVENLTKALESSKAALRVFSRTDFPEDWARTLNNIGGAYTKLPTRDRSLNLSKSLDCYRLACEVFTEEDYPLDWAGLQSNIGYTHFELPTGDQRDNLSRGISHCQAALRVFTEAEYPLDWATVQHNIGSALGDLPDTDGSNLNAAINCLQAALRVHNERDHPTDWARIQNGLGNLRRRLSGRDKDLSLVRDHYEAALRVYTEQSFPWNWALVQNNLGTMWVTVATEDRAGNLRKAITHFQAALRIHREESFPIDWARAQSNLGGAYVELREIDPSVSLEPAIESLRAALRVYTAGAMLFDRLNVLYNLCTAYYREGRWQETLPICNEVIELLESGRAAALTSGERHRLFSEKAAVFERAVISSIEIRNFPDALLYTERGKTRNLFEALVRRDAKPKGVVESEWRAYLDLVAESEARERQLNTGSLRDPTIAADYQIIRDELTRSRTRLDAYEARFRHYDPDYLRAAPPLTLDDIRTIFQQPDSVLVEFCITEAGAFVFLMGAEDVSVTEQQVIHVPDFTNRALRELLIKRTLNDGLEDGWLVTYHRWRRREVLQQQWMDCMDETIRSLQTRLLARVHERLKILYPEAKQLILVPNKGLNLLPLHAGCYEFEGKLRHWVDDYEVLYAPSCAVFSRCLRTDKGRRKREALFAVQNPVSSSATVLPFADWDVEEAARYFPVKHILPGVEATLEQVKRLITRGHEILLSCHGAYNLDDVFASYLTLHGDERLLLSDILRLDLSDSWLTVLSACETTLTDYRDVVDEVQGLHIAFLLAHTPTVVGSLWSVSDLSTALLMKRFHQNLYRRNLSKAKALQEAQCWLRDLPVNRVHELLDEKRREWTQGDVRERLAAINLAKARLDELAASYGGKPFAHPYWWAAFQCVGAA